VVAGKGDVKDPTEPLDPELLAVLRDEPEATYLGSRLLNAGLPGVGRQPPIERPLSPAAPGLRRIDAYSRWRLAARWPAITISTSAQ
jgi:hypothetical protein